MTNDELLDAFGREHEDYHAISRDRRVRRRRILNEAAGGRPFADVTADDLRAHLGELIDQGYAPTSIESRLKVMRPFLEWLWRKGLIDAERLMDFKTVKAPRGSKKKDVPRPYTRAEIKAMWERVEQRYEWNETTLGRFRAGGILRWRKVSRMMQRSQTTAVLSLALFGGLRRDEIFRLSLEDMDPENAYLVVQGARKNEAAEIVPRVVPWQSHMRGAVHNWLAMREEVLRWAVKRGDLTEPHDAPWLSLSWEQHYYKPINAAAFQRMPWYVGVELHRLRHTAATEMLRARMDITHVQRILGHSRIQQTLGYAAIIESDLVSAAARTDEARGAALGYA